MSGVAEACDARGAGISLVSAANDEALAWNIRSAVVDGFILFCIEGGERLVRLTRERGLPFIALALGVNDATIPAIGIDNVEGGRLAARHLARLGHKRYAILALPLKEDGHYGRVDQADLREAVFATAIHRVQGYFEVLAQSGIDTASIPIYETRNEAVSVRSALAELFAGGPAPTAILAESDQIGLIAMAWLRERGLSVPGDVSIVGFDGIAEAALSDPPLTTIAQPMAEQGRMAVTAILDRDDEVRRQILPVELVVRGSAASPKA
jgi:DNA-binding LacI/PurR family transcriptional regulator